MPRPAHPGRKYLPRAWLDLAPVLIGDARVSFPPIEGYVDLIVDISLMVDQDGRVQRVEVRTPDVHEAFVRAVTDAFSSVRFKPGEVGGVPVPSEIQIQVEFRA